MKSAVPFCFEYLLKLREKVRGNLVCCLMWGYFENKSLGLSEIFEVDSLARKLTKKYITNKSI